MSTRSSTHLLLVLVAVSMTGCAYFQRDEAPRRMHWTTDDNAAPPGWNSSARPTSTVTLGEKIRHHPLALRTHATGTYDLYVGGLFYAQYHPWQHELMLRPEATDAPAGVCRFSPGGELQVETPAAGGSDGERTPAALSPEACRQLYVEVENYVLRR